VPEILRIMDEQTRERIPVLVGGIIPPQDIPTLKQAGILEVFPSGSSVDEIVGFVRDNVRKR
jgi:methylmalonyl-CoA mutase C-terminal domain/subunit